MDNKLNDYFLNGYLYDEKNTSEFNYRFNYRWSIKLFNEEFNKFIYMLNTFYYDNDRLVTGFNSYNIIIPQKVIKHIIKLYKYSKDHNLDFQMYIISDFLLSYYNTININKGNIPRYKRVEKQFRNILSEMIGRSYYPELLNIVYSFYLMVVPYGIKNEKYIAPEVVKKILNNTKDESKQNVIIEELLKNDKYCFIVVNYDKRIDSHKKYYLAFIERILGQEYGYDNINNILSKIINTMTKAEIKKIVNIYITKTNDLCNKYKYKKEVFINSLHEIEHLKNNLSEILQINTLDKKYTVKIHECIINLLALKRFLLLDDDYINSGLKEISETTTVKQKDIDSFINQLKTNKFNIYGASSIDFDKTMESALKYYSEFALLSVVSNYTINSKTQTYTTNDIFSITPETVFEKYYDNIGREYTLNNKDTLMNKLGNGYYKELLRYLSTTYNMHQSLTINMLGVNNFTEIIDSLKKEIGYENRSDYVSIVSNIVAIEIIINKLLTKNSKKYTGDTINNLSILFEIYKNNKRARNGLMYIYYSLYEHTGPRLRNKAMHGTIVGQDLSMPLLVTFSALIFVSWLLNE